MSTCTGGEDSARLAMLGRVGNASPFRSGWKSFFITLLAFALTWSSPVSALTINNLEYDLFAGFRTPDKLGYWTRAEKFLTAEAVDGTPVNVGAITGLDPAFSRYDLDKFFAMGMVAEPRNDTELVNGSFELTNSAGEAVLSGTYLSNGRLSAIPRSGTRGQLDVVGLFTVTGGLAFDDNVIRGTVYLEMFFDSVFALGGGDMGAIFGQINLYSRVNGERPPEPPSNEVPEPTTVVLLGSSLLGYALKRARAVSVL